MKHLDLSTIETSALHLIEASAGTGKTWMITALYILLLLEEQMRPEEILVVTYTKSATAELRDRIRNRISDTLDLYVSARPARDQLEELLLHTRSIERELAIKLLTRALYSFDNASIYTIHGFCQRSLLENAFESGSLFDTDMINDQSAILRDVCDDFWRIHIMTESDEFLKKLTAKGCTPGTLAEPFKGHYQNSTLTVIPSVENPDLPALACVCSKIASHVADLWRSDQDDILDQLTRANLSLTSYKPIKVNNAAHGITQWLEVGNASAPCPSLKLFTTAAIMSGHKKGSTTPDHPFFELCQELYEALQQIETAFDHRLIFHQIALQQWIRKELAIRKQALNQRCYDDLLLDLHRALTGDGGGQLAHNLRERYRAALIDEFQDTDPLQWQIFSHLAGIHTKADSYPLFLIGDPKQAIYSFRGADIFAYIEAGKAVELHNRSTLTTNRRSVAPLVTAVNALFNTADDPFLSRDIDFTPVDSGRNPEHQLLHDGISLEQPLQFWIYPRDDQTQAVRKNEACRTIVRTVAEQIARLLDGSYEIIDKRGRRQVGPGDIAVLVKAHYQADLMQIALNERSIPSVQHGSTTIFETIEAQDVLRILRAAHEPSRERLLREALLTSSMGLTANQVSEYMDECNTNSPWETWLLRFRMLHDAALNGGIMTMAELLLGECGVRQRVLSRNGGERILTNILQCVELLHHAEQEHVNGLEALILWLERRITSDVEDETALLRLETDENAVQLSTIHASKGLEYPIVFLPFAWDAPSSRNSQVLFHDADGTLTLDLGSDQQDEHKIIAKQERAAEAARLLYVAITRAEFLCYVAWGCISDAHNSPLFTLLHGATVKDSKGFKSYPDEAILNDVSALNGETDCLAAVFMPVDVPAPPYQPTSDAVKSLVCHTLCQPIPNDWRVTSFSAMIAGSERYQQPRDYDAVGTAIPELESFEQAGRGGGNSIFDFPRGAAAGTCLHEIFEHLDFSALSEQQIIQTCRATLLANGYQEEWIPAVAGMVTAVTGAPVISASSEFNLARLSKGSWQSEMEFFLPIAQLTPAIVRSLFNGVLNPSHHGDFPALLETLDFRTSRGMLHGFMDMVFVENGRYYIIDWKSNHLGFSIHNYSQAVMTHSMAEHAYILQYHLYVLALDRHLRGRVPGYSYETHFGGVLYIYLRGVSGNDQNMGIYRDRPRKEFIRRAHEYMLM